MNTHFYFQRPKLKPVLVSVFFLQIVLLYIVSKSYAGFIAIFIALLQPLPYMALVRKFLAQKTLRKPYFISRDELVNFVKLQVAYLGCGFLFRPQHGRLLHELMDAGLTTSKKGGHGCPALHTLDLNNTKPILQSLRDLNSHTLIFGTTGAGKTRMFDLLTTQAILRGETVIVFDPKGDQDLLLGMIKTCRCYGRKNDLISFDMLNPDKGICWDVLDSYRTASEIGDRITSLMSSASANASFKAYANSAITSCVIALKLKHEAITLANIRQMLTDFSEFGNVLNDHFRKLRLDLTEKEVHIYYDRLLKNGSIAMLPLRSFYRWLIEKEYIKADPDIEMLFATACMDRNYYEKITAGALPILNALCAGKLYRALSSDHAMSFSTLLRQRLVVYISLRTLIDSSTGGNLGRLMLADLCACAGYNYSENDHDTRISVFIDEASELMCESLIQLLNKSRGAGFAVTLATQTLSDLCVRGGSKDAALQMMGNTNNLICMRIVDPETAKMVSATFPSVHIAERSSSTGYNEGEGIPLGGQVLRSLSSKQSEIFPPQALPLLPDFEYLARLADGRTIKGRIPLLKD